MKLLELLDRTEREKTLLVAGVAFVIELSLGTWVVLAWFLSAEGREALNDSYTAIILSAHGSFTLIWLVALLSGTRIRSDRACERYTSFVLVFFMGSMLFNAWLVGLFSFTNGVLLVGGPLLSVLLFESRIALKVSVFAIASYFLGGVLTIAGVLPYAPVFDVLPVSHEGLWLFQVAPDLMLSMSLVTFIFSISYALIVRSRQREREVRALSVTDELTGLDNRRAVMGFLQAEMALQKRRQSRISVALMDLDHFKTINDTYGHDVGDLVLRRAAESLQGVLRESDRVGRYGGEEFLLVLPDTDIGSARQVIERCRAAVGAVRIPAGDGKLIEVTGSFGIASVSSEWPVDDAKSLLIRVDRALYRAKRTAGTRLWLRTQYL